MKRKRRSPKKAIIAGIILLLVIAVALLGLPQSTVMVTVAAETFEQTVPIKIVTNKEEQADVEGTETEETDEVIAAMGTLLELENDDAQRVVATGKKDVGGKAKGTVVISNAWDSNPIKLAAGTTFTAADGKVFDLADGVTVPGATATLSQGQLVATPGKVNATINATEPGENYNIAATKFTIQGIPAERQDKIFAESSKDFSGGFTKQVSVMTQGDIDTAKDALVEDLTNQAKEEFNKKSENKKLLSEALAHEVTNVETNPKETGSETDYFDIKVKVRHRAVVFDEKEVNTAVDTAIRKEVPTDKELLLGDDDAFVIEVKETSYDAGELLLEAKVKTKIGTRIDPQEAKKGLAGKNEESVRATLSSLPNVKEVSIHKLPGWWWQDISFVSWNTRVKVIYE